MAKLYAGSDSPERLLDLVGQADSYLTTAEASLAGQFFNGIAELADNPNLTGLRDDLRDRALLGIASKMRQWAGESIAPGRIVSVLMGQSSAWPPPIVSDAAFAAKCESQRVTRTKATGMISVAPTIRGGNPVVTATCWAPETGEIFLGFASGEIVCYRPSSGEVAPLPVGPFLGNVTIYGDAVSGTSLFRGDPITCLATNAKAQLVVALSQKDDSKTARLMSFAQRPNSGYVLRESRSIPVSGRAWLSSVLTHKGHHVAVSTGEVVQLLSGAALVPMDHMAFHAAPSDVYTEFSYPPYVVGLLLPRLMEIGALLLGGGFAWPLNKLQDDGSRAHRILRLGWTPGIPEGSSLQNPPLSMLQTSDSDLELAGITKEGCLYWSRIRFAETDKTEVHTDCTQWPHHEGYLAMSIIKSGVVVGVKKGRVEWLRSTSEKLAVKSETKIDFPSPVSCYPHYPTNELVLISSEGTVARIPMH